MNKSTILPLIIIGFILGMASSIFNFFGGLYKYNQIYFDSSAKYVILIAAFYFVSIILNLKVKKLTTILKKFLPALRSKCCLLIFTTTFISANMLFTNVDKMELTINWIMMISSCYWMPKAVYRGVVISA